MRRISLSELCILCGLCYILLISTLLCCVHVLYLFYAVTFFVCFYKLHFIACNIHEINQCSLTYLLTAPGMAGKWSRCLRGTGGRKRVLCGQQEESLLRVPFLPEFDSPVPDRRQASGASGAATSRDKVLTDRRRACQVSHGSSAYKGHANDLPCKRWENR